MTDSAPRPLDALRVLELSTGISGPYAGKLLVDAGATVVKIEPPGGDPLRRWTASAQPLAEGEDGVLFQFLDAGKQSVVLDPGDAADRDTLVALAARADLLIEDWGPGGLEAAGLEPDALQAANPALSIVRISPWGQSGPWARRPANDFTLQAASGSTDWRGLPGGDPVAAGGRIGDWIAGAFAGLGALVAWRSARSTGRGVVADCSSFEAMLLCMTTYGDLDAQFRKAPIPRSTDVPSIEPTADGHIGFAIVTGQQWVDLCSMIGRRDLAEDPRFLHAVERNKHSEMIQAAIHPWTRARTQQEIGELCELLRIPFAPIGNGETLPAFDHIVERGIYQRAPAGHLQPRAPWRLESAEPAPLRPAPRLDADRDAVLAALASPRADAPAEGGSALPFEGLRVVDLTAFWAGPFAATILGDLGADVVKVESIQRPDGMRFAAGGDDPIWERSFVFHGANPGKRDVTLRIDDPRGLDLLKRLIERADVVIENFSARVMPNFGLDAETIRALNPRAIFVRMPAYGLDGPWRDRAGFAMTIEQVSGMAWVTGPEDRPMVVRGACDPAGGAHTVFALGLALEERRRTGRGQLLEVPLVEPALNMAAEQVLEHSAYGALLGRSGNAMPHAAPQGLFDSDAPETRLAVSVTTDAEWRALAGALGADDLAARADLAHHAGRRAAHAELCERIGRWTSARSRDEALEILLAAGVPAAAVVNGFELMPNPQLVHRGFYQTMKHAVMGELRYPGLPFALSGLPRALHRAPPPMLGEHNREVLQGELGLSDEEIEALERDQIIGTRPSFL